MPTGRRHLTRHEMQQDEFVSWVTRATLWVEDNSRTVVMGIGGVALAIVIGIGLLTWSRGSQEAGFMAVGEIQKIARTPLAGEAGALPGAFANPLERAASVVAEADRVLKSRPSGSASEWARYHRAAALLEMSRHTEAAESIAPVVASAGDSLLGDLSRVLAGRVEEARGNFDQAAALYATAAEKAGERFPPETALMDRARCLAAAGKKQEAIDAYQKVLDTYPDSPMASRATQKIQDLRGGAPASDGGPA